MSAFGGKADMAGCGSPLSRSLLGVKRTWASALHMSAYDPKRTLAYRSTTHLWPLQCVSLRSFRRLVLIIGCGHEAAGVHHISRRLGRVPACGARPEAGDVGGRFSRRPVSSALCALCCCGSSRAEGSRLCRAPECSDGVPLG